MVRFRFGNDGHDCTQSLQCSEINFKRQRWKKQKDESVSPAHGNQGILKKLTESFANCCFATYSFAIAVRLRSDLNVSFFRLYFMSKLDMQIFLHLPPTACLRHRSTRLVYISPRIHWLLISEALNRNSSLLKWVQYWQRGGLFMFIHQLCVTSGDY